jgi:hypothetical protein
VKYCVFATSTKRGPKSQAVIAGSAEDDARPLWVADGVVHGAPQDAAFTLCGLSTEGLHGFADLDFESVTIQGGACEKCAAAVATHDDEA